MTGLKATKRALISSVIALFLCFSMLLGTTFAWFTDSVTSSGNIIQSGTLDVTMEWADGTKAIPAEDSADWKDASAGAIFKSSLWEPGYVEVRHIKIANEGTLALKYQVSVIPNGTVSDLTDVIDVYYVDPAVQVADRAALSDSYKIGTLTQVLANLGTTAYGELLAGDKDTVTLAFKMQETAGNEYQGKSIGSDFAIRLLATQLAYEEDSFDDQYDAAATYLNKDANGNYVISSVSELLYLAQEVNSGNSYKNESFVLTADIDLGGMNWTPIGSPAHSFSALFDGQNHTVSNFKVDVVEYAGLFGDARNGGDIKNLIVKDADIKAVDRAGAIIGAGYTMLENCHAIDCTVIVAPAIMSNGTYDGGAKAGGVMGQVWEGAGNGLNGCTATNVTVIGYRDIGAVLGMAHNNNTVTDCKAYDSEVSYLFLGADQVYGDGSVNSNIGEVVGRVQSSATVSGSVSENVKINAIYVYGLKLVPDGANSGTIFVDSKEALLNLGKLKADWAKLFSNGLGTEYSNYATQNGGVGTDYYYHWGWTVELTSDIDLGGAEIDPIDLGQRSVLDGKGHTIKNAVIVTDPTTENEAGLFNAAKCGVKDLKLDNIHVTGSLVGNSTAGVLSGSSNSANGVKNITVTNSSVTGGKYTGGVIGYGYTDVKGCSLTNVTVKGGYKLGGVIGYICAGSNDGHDVNSNTLVDCTVDGIGDGKYADGKTAYIVGKVVGNYNCDGVCLENTVTNMTTSATANIGKIEAGKDVTETGTLVSTFEELQNAIDNGASNIVLDGNIDLGSGGGIVIP